MTSRYEIAAKYEIPFNAGAKFVTVTSQKIVYFLRITETVEGCYFV